ncbi:MAG TPA: glycine cleavage system protein GcvH [Polyangiales bacterium]|nr:glycine cleavage system protein GcvH [Polyangiales bacterium]
MANYPAELKYTKDHEWARIEGDLIRVGITQHAVDQLGDVTLVDLPKVGASVKSGAHFGDIESVKAVSELFAPLAGEIVEVNTKLTDKPELVNEAPYESGWMIVLRPSDQSQLASLLDAAAYEAFVGSL